MTARPVPPAVLTALDAAEALCRVYVGKDAESEQWIETCRRLEALSRKLKAARRALAKAEGTER